MNKTNFFYVGIMSILFIAGCSDNNKLGSQLIDFDISADGRTIVYAIRINDNQTALYKGIVGEADAALFIEEKDCSFTGPKFSMDGNKIIFIGNDHLKKETSIWETAAGGASKKRILSDNGFISEVIPSMYDDFLFYTKAQEYDSYSPIAPKARHNYDVYKINRLSLKNEKISDLRSYALYALAEFDESKLIVSRKGADTESGVFMVDKDSHGWERRIETTNDTLRNSAAYAYPVRISDEDIICSSYYQLVEINLKTKLEKVILPSNGYHFRKICYNRKLDRIFFLKKDDTNTIYSVDTDGKNLRELTINLGDGSH